MSWVRFTRDRKGDRDRPDQRRKPRPRHPRGRPLGYDDADIPRDYYEAVFQGTKGQILSRIFGSFWSYVAQLLSAVIWRNASTISDGIVYFILTILVLCAFVYVLDRDYIKRAWTWKELKKVNPLVWIILGIGFAFIWNLYGHVDILYEQVDQVRSHVQLVDAKVIKMRQELDARFYTPAIADDGWWKPVDDRIVGVLNRLGISRASLGWGCFAQGTLIQIDADGHEVAIEELLYTYGEYEFVYNGVETVPIRYISVGNETGYLYEVTTMDEFAVNVTETHAMNMCQVLQDVEDGGVGRIECGCNRAAKNVREGDWTVTRNGQQQIKSIRKYAVRDVPVYNIWLDMPGNTSLSSRVVVANGIQTFDLLRQKEHQ